MPIEIALPFILLGFVLGYLLGLAVAKSYLHKAKIEVHQEIARTLEEIEKSCLQ